MDNKELLHRQRNIELSKFSNIQFDGIDTKDWPDLSDAFIVSAEYNNRVLIDSELDYLNSSDLVYELLMNEF
jgi:hypothetical protein